MDEEIKRLLAEIRDIQKERLEIARQSMEWAQKRAGRADDQQNRWGRLQRRTTLLLALSVMVIFLMFVLMLWSFLRPYLIYPY
jgi:hypothetical protein